MKLASKEQPGDVSRLFHLFQVIYNSGKIGDIFNRLLRQSQKFPRVPILFQETRLKIDEFLNNVTYNSPALVHTWAREGLGFRFYVPETKEKKHAN